MSSNPYDTDMYESLSDPNLPGYYIQQNQKEAVDEELGLLDYGKAAATGLYHGAVLTAPETMVRVLHRIGKGVGSEDMVNWARGKLDEYSRLREEDPYWQPDEEWMTSYTAKSLYEGFNSVSNSMAMMLPGLAAAPLTGGMSLGAMFIGGALGAGTIGGLAEYDSFLDDAYKQLSTLNPELSREDIEDEHFWNAVLSGVAEGGFELAGDLVGGKLIGLVGKAGAQPARNILSKLLRNAGKSMLAETPSELVTAAAQDWLRENSGLDHQGRLKAMVNALGPALVSGGAFGAAGTISQELRPMHISEVKAAMDTHAKSFIEAQQRDRYGDIGFGFLKDTLIGEAGMEEKTAIAIADIAQAEAKRWAETNGRDINDWWKDKTSQVQSLTEGGWSSTTALAQTLVTPEASFDAVIGQSAKPLVSSLTQEQQTALATKYNIAEGGTTIELDMDAVSQDFQSWLKDPKSVELDAQTQPAFEAMRDKILDSYGALKQNNAVKISPEAQGMFDRLFGQTERPVPEAPKMYTVADEAALNQELDQIASNDPDANAKIVAALNKKTKYNFSPWALKDDAKATFLAIDKALAPYLDKYLAKQTDASADAKAKADMNANGYSEAGINSLFGDVVDNKEGTLSQRSRKAQIYQALALENMKQLALEYNETPSPQSALALMAAREVFKGIHIQMRGIRAEAGRFLRSYRMAGQDNKMDIRRLNELMEGSGGMGAVDALSAILTNTQDPALLKERLEGTLWDKTTGMLLEHVTLGMLTNPATQIVNVAGNGLTLMQEVVNRFVGSHLNPDQKNGLVKGETMAMLNGLYKGLQNIRETFGKYRQEKGGALRAIFSQDAPQFQINGASLLDDGGQMGRKLTRENAQDVLNGVGDWVGTRESKIPGMSSAHAAATGGLSTAIEYYGRGLGLISKGLLTADMVFKTLAYHMELNATTFRRAAQEAQATGGDVQALHKQYSEKALKVDKDAAMDFAKKVTFQSDLGAIGKNINKIRQEAPLTRLIIPFLKTPINIIKYGAAHTPGMSQLFKETKAELGSKDAAVRQLAEARVMTGSMIWMGALGLATQGFLTGNGPTDPEEKKRLQATGWQANSLKLTIGGETHYIGLDRLDPGAFILNTAASFVEIAQHLEGEDAEKASSAAIGAAIRTVTNRSYIQSVQSILDLVMNLDKPEGQRAVRDLITNVTVPASALSRTTARTIDPIARETDTIFNQIMSNIPGFSTLVPERRNFLGEVMKAPDALGPDYLSPLRYSAGNNDPVYSEISRLGQLGLDMPSTAQRIWRNGDKSVRLDAKQYAAFMEEAGTKHRINGKTAKEHLAGLVESSLYQQASDEQKASLIKGAVDSYRKAAKNKMMRTDPGVRYLLGLR